MPGGDTHVLIRLDPGDTVPARKEDTGQEPRAAADVSEVLPGLGADRGFEPVDQRRRITRATAQASQEPPLAQAERERPGPMLLIGTCGHIMRREHSEPRAGLARSS